ncbi:Cyclin, N-terminal domain [Nesidiocoris tenuis]|uniref:Cyclin, N-terminal domain n=1 Tax=Nesidiocoris tenuis TaxID=355587 RepID=A0ABN7ABG3_9HEMI|nr:Cyclin, N-terminal domain [Nesidiocoris tenuis]
MGSHRAENHTSTSYKQPVKPYGKVELSLNNVLLPEEKLVNTPSRQDGMSVELETDLRILGCELIQTAGILLKLPQVAMATGQVLFQRFYYSKSFVRHGMEVTAMACVTLASKIEEAIRRIRDVINVFHHIRQVNSQKPITPLIPDQNYITLKNQVIKAERRILKELGFCVHVKHPHKIIVMYLQVLGCERNKDFMQLSWNYMNDALRSDVFMRHDPETVAIACIYLSARYLGICLARNPPWYGLFKVTEANIIAVCQKILQLYTRPKVNADELEKKVEELKRLYQESKVKARTLVSGNNTPNSNNSPMRNNHNDKGRSLSDSRSRSPSRTPTKHKRSKGHRNRSRSNDRKSNKKHRRRSYSASPSPTRHNKHTREKTRYRSRSRSPRSDSYDKYYSSSDKKSRSKHRDYEDSRIRSRH